MLPQERFEQPEGNLVGVVHDVLFPDPAPAFFPAVILL